ncbi:MAG: ABC transporter permease [Acinetobacter populi]|jgi:sulfonate transport system permease protein|uniref:ABC transporter permease n=1 Tax=Acinetobacter populi TaxID=1582270 RepID=UPI002354401A|nr:ABC transporter permease [Acinetobacter populi]MCH4247176.1 ABC transporter permease [Acinetobacter populi]
MTKQNISKWPEQNSKIYLGLERINTITVYWTVPILLFILWWIASNQQWMSAQILPTPQLTWQTFKALSGENLWWQLGVSLKRLIQGLLIGVVFGIFLGILIGYFRKIDELISPIFYALSIIPILALLPLLMIWLGIGDGLKVFMIFKSTLIPITLHVQAGVRNIQPQLKEMAEVLRLSKYILFRKLILPATLPYLITGLRLAVAASWTTLIAVELLASSEGIGYLLVTGRQLFQLDVVFVCIFLIALMGIIFDYSLQYFERKLIIWPHPTLSAYAVTKKKTGIQFKVWILPSLLLLFWVITTHYQWISLAMLPEPYTVFQTMYSDIRNGTISTALYYSLYRALLGLLIGGGLGIIVGLALGLIKPLENLFAPTLNTLRLVSIFAWIPLMTAWFGLGDFAKIVFISLATFFPMFIATWKGVGNISMQLKEASDILRLDYIQRLKILVLPSITPSIFAGLRLALLYSWMASFGAEYLMGSGIGIGSYIMSAQQNFEMDKVITATILIALLGAFFSWLGNATENYATAWRKNER